MIEMEQHDERQGDAVGELLRLAEVPEISPERTARHRELARAHWQRKVQARSRRRQTYGLAAAAVVVLALGLWLTAGRDSDVSSGPMTAEAPAIGDSTAPAHAGPVARLSALAGTVHRAADAADTPTTLDAGSQVDAGTVLETGAGSRAAFQLASGHELRLDVDTRLRLVSERTLTLERGALYVDSRGAPSTIEIRTPLGTARDVGTRFEVRLGSGELRVRVRDGVVEVDRAGETHQAGAGAELTLDATGTPARRAIPVYGPEWRWSLEVAPAFDLERRTLSEFLAWVTHETGWRLRLDPAVARGAAGVTLNGSIDDLAPDEALEVVLPTTGLRHRVADGELIVEPLT